MTIDIFERFICWSNIEGVENYTREGFYYKMIRMITIESYLRIKIIQFWGSGKIREFLHLHLVSTLI